MKSQISEAKEKKNDKKRKKKRNKKLKEKRYYRETSEKKFLNLFVCLEKTISLLDYMLMFFLLFSSWGRVIVTK